MKNYESNNTFNVSLGEVQITIKKFKGIAYDEEYNLMACSDDDLDTVTNADECIYEIAFIVKNYGTFNCVIELTWNDIDIDLHSSYFNKGDYNIWKKFLEFVCNEYIGDLEEYGWGEDLLNELKKQF